MKISPDNSMQITYQQRNITKKQDLQDPQDSIREEKKQIRQLAAESPAYLDLSTSESSFRNYFDEISKHMHKGDFSGAIEQYDKLQNEINENNPEGETRTKLSEALGMAYDNASGSYAMFMRGNLLAMSGTKLKANIPQLGQSQKVDTERVKTNQKDLHATKEVENEIKQTLLSLKDFYHKNGGLSGFDINTFDKNPHTLAISDLSALSSGSFLKDLSELQKSGASNESISDNINKSGLSDNAKSFFNDIAKKSIN